MKDLRVKDKVVGVDQSRHVGCGPHSTSSGNRRGIECVCALYSDLRGEADVPRSSLTLQIFENEKAPKLFFSFVQRHNGL
ncbi:hypothetical protein Y032_0222g2626 [Ancylostoma ceylanicum]|uniref:Uncharacterized protein n=1 Tax=Ancylostoma ceylanicum TaxID=53326 RepID=A0A016SIT1_9BILA|nr:hypothetical protein Y032_0222g2626 [Ancylostoma ceylanicum]